MSAAVTPSQNVLTINSLQASVRCPALLQIFTVITTLVNTSMSRDSMFRTLPDHGLCRYKPQLAQLNLNL